MSDSPWFKIAQGLLGVALAGALLTGALMGQTVTVTPVWLAILAIPVCIAAILDLILAVVRFKLRAVKKELRDRT